jgi:hypothetical protein
MVHIPALVYPLPEMYGQLAQLGRENTQPGEETEGK